MEELAALLETAPARLRGKRAAVGFDGFQDRILRPIRKIEGGALEYFETMGEFGAFLQQRQGKSCSIELDVQLTKLGGNCPIFSAALGLAGVRTDCVGMFTGGDFNAMPPACTLHSYAKTATADCLEFADGKLMLASRCTMQGAPYAQVLAAVPNLHGLFTGATLAAFLNYSELDFASALWSAIEQEVFAAQPPKKAAFAFFDLCDIERKAAADIEGVLDLISRFSRVRHTVLSVNENECLLLGRLLGQEEPEGIARALNTRFAIAEVVVHTLRESCVLAGGRWHIRPTIFCKRPVISTGAGDNFNAGYCLGLLLTQNVGLRLALANLFAHTYITTGHSQGLNFYKRQIEK